MLSNPSQRQQRKAIIMTMMAALRSLFLDKSNSLTLSRLVLYGLYLRVFQWLFMAGICAISPSHSPGEDVVGFDLRLNDDSDDCFAHVNTFCECGYTCEWQKTTLSTVFATATSSTTSSSAMGCHTMAKTTTNYTTNFLHSHVYPFLLRPLTRWDAARFLRLALRPQLWYPYPQFSLAGEQSFSSSSSEMAHAFFPMFPAAIQRTAHLLLTWFPSYYLPSSCEGVLVLAAWILNTVCFAIALVSLHQTTYLMLSLSQQQQQQGGGTSADGDDRNAKIGEPFRRYANLVGLLFVCNPASVFFNTAYSESLFAAFIFTGAYGIARWGPLGAVVPWSLATATRSNGILYFGYMMLLGAGYLMQSKRPKWLRIRDLFVCLVVGDYILYPLYRHNCNGIAYHCENNDISSSSSRVEWCDEAQNNPYFFLYSYVQRKYWNVGFLRYYEWKQIPNFILAAPILILSCVAVMDWIHRSWRFTTSADQKPFHQQVLVWIVESLRQFVAVDRGPKSSHESPETVQMTAMYPSALGHFAVLAIAALLGLTTAHVQISTRLLCSSCPALYWYAAHLVSTSEKWGSVYLVYCVSYIVLGTILHPLWLPWT